MASAWLPSILLWQGMQRRANCLPMLMQYALQDDSSLAIQRVSVCLRQLAALACFVKAVRFSLYCRECNKLLSIYEQHNSRRAELAPLLLCATVRATRSLVRPLRCLIDSSNLNELRQARTGAVVAQITPVHCSAWAVPSLKTLLRKHLMHAHYTLRDASNDYQHGTAPTQPNNFMSLNRAAALWLGKVVFESIEDAKNYQQTCKQILRLELCCQGLSVSEAPRTFPAMQKIFLDLSTRQSLRGLRSGMRGLIRQAEQQATLHLEQSLRAFHEVNVCCTLCSSHEMQAIEKISVCAQRLALHLRCWEESEAEANVLLCLCVLALERQLDIAIAVLEKRRICEYTDRRLLRKVHHFIRTHRRRLRTEYALPVSGSRTQALEELQGIHHIFQQNYGLLKQTHWTGHVEDELFHALIRCKAIALYMGAMSLYEALWNFRELLVLAIERKLVLSKILVGLLPRLSAYCLRHCKQGGRSQSYDARLINTLSEELRAQRQRMLFKMVLHDNWISLPTRKRRGKKRDTHTILTTQLPSFLAKNIRSLIADPIAICSCNSAPEFAGLSREIILELTLLARGARALQVDRVAALSEVLLEIYRSLNAVTVLPEQRVLKPYLYGAHRRLRLALNQAAARQRVCDVRPTIARLYHFLECLHRAHTHSPDSLQATLSAVNSLAADLRAFADVFARVLNNGRGTRVHLAQEQLQGLLTATRCLQEDVAANGMVSIARWRPPLIYAVGRYSNDLGKPARLDFDLDEIAISRALVQRLQLPIERVLSLMIEQSIEGVSQRRAAGKPDSARLHLRVTCCGAGLTLSLEDDGVGLTLNQLKIVIEEIEPLGGAISLPNEVGIGSLVRLTIPCASVRWDIASKSL